jgi:hypothetical protein
MPFLFWQSKSNELKSKKECFLLIFNYNKPKEQFVKSIKKHKKAIRLSRKKTFKIMQNQ